MQGVTVQVMHQGPCLPGAAKIFPKEELVELLESLQAPVFFKYFFFLQSLLNLLQYCFYVLCFFLALWHVGS